MRSILKRTPEGIELDVIAVFQTLVHYAWLIAFVGVGFALISAVNTCLFVTPQYTASVSMYVNNNTMTMTGISISDMTASTQVAKTYNALITSSKVLEAMLDEADITDLTADELAGKVSAVTVDDTQYVTISVVDSDPKRAAALASAFEVAVPEVLEEIVVGSAIRIVDSPKVPTMPSYPNVPRSIAAGALFGIVVGIAVVVLWSIMDNTLKSEDEIQEWSYPLLGVIPDHAIAKKSRSAYKYQ